MPDRIIRLWVICLAVGWVWVNYDERDMPKKNSPILFDDPEELQAEDEEREPSLDDEDCGATEEPEEEVEDLDEDDLDGLDDGPEDFDF